MRRVLALILVAAMALGFQSAWAAGSLGQISGRLVDAAGRGVASQRVDLLQGGQAVSAAISDARGLWSFANVTPGEYVVRTNINGSIAGTRVMVGTGQVVAGTTIVVPTSAVSPQFGVLAGVLANAALAGSTAAVAAASAVVNTTEAVSLDAATVAEILTQLPPADRQAFAQAVVEAINNNLQGTNSTQAQSNFFVDTTQSSTGVEAPTNNFFQVIQAIATTPPSQQPTTITIVVTAS